MKTFKLYFPPSSASHFTSSGRGHNDSRLDRHHPDVPAADSVPIGGQHHPGQHVLPDGGQLRRRSSTHERPNGQSKRVCFQRSPTVFAGQRFLPNLRSVQPGHGTNQPGRLRRRSHN